MRVPPQFRKQPQLVLQIGLNMPIPIRDLQVDDDGVGCTLSFSRTPFYCVMPWTSVFALVGEDGRAMVWPDDVPPEVAAQSQARAEAPREKPKPEPRPRAVRAPKREKVPDAPPSDHDVRTKLAIVPEESAPEDNRAEVTAQEATEAASEAPAASPASPVAAPKPDATRKKRELPPYLRVVK